MIGLILDNDSRILCAGKYPKIPEGVIAIEDSHLPDGNIIDYKFIDNKFIYDPLPELEIEPSTDEKVTTLENQNVLLMAQIQALSSRNDFLEDCLAEMACIIYA